MQAVLCFIVLLLFVPFARAQALVDFRNGGITFRTTANRLVSLCSERLVGTNYVAALYYLPGGNRGGELGPDGGFLAYGSNHMAYANFRDRSTSLAGVWINPIGVGVYRFLDFVDPGEIATLQVRVWDSTLYGDFASAVRAGEYYASAPFNYLVPFPGAPKEDYYMEELRANSLPCVPRLSVVRTSGAVTLSWPLAAPGFVVEEALALPGATPLSWTPVPLPYQTNLDRVTLNRPLTSANRFYRLIKR